MKLKRILIFVNTLGETISLFLVRFWLMSSLLLTAIAMAFIFFYVPFHSLLDKRSQKLLAEELTVEYPITTTTRFDTVIAKIADVEEQCVDSYSGKVIKYEDQVYIWYQEVDDENLKLWNAQQEELKNLTELRFDKDNNPNYCQPDLWRLPSHEIGVGDTYESKGECIRSDSALKVLDKIYPKTDMDTKLRFGSMNENQDFKFLRAYPAECKITVKSINTCFRDDQLTPTTSHISGYEEALILSGAGLNNGEFINQYRCDHPSHLEFLLELKRKTKVSIYD